MWVPRARAVLFAGVLAVLLGGVTAATGAGTSDDVNLRSGVTPWAFGVLVVGVGLILFGSYRCGIGRPALLVRWGSRLSFVGLGCAAAFFFGTGILTVVGSDLLSTGDTLVSTLGTLAASVCTLLVLPIGLLALSVAVLADKELVAGMRVLPLVGSLSFMVGPALVAVLPESGEPTVLLVWPVLLGALWAAYGLLVIARLSRQASMPAKPIVASAR